MSDIFGEIIFSFFHFSLQKAQNRSWVYCHLFCPFPYADADFRSFFRKHPKLAVFLFKNQTPIFA